METSANKTLNGSGQWEDMAAPLPVVNLLIFVVMGLASLLGIATNLGVVVIFRKIHKLRSTTNQLVEVLAYLDLMMSIFGLPICAASALRRRFVWHSPGFVIYGATMTYLGLSNINVLTAIAVERYLCIVHCHRKLHLSPRVTTVCIPLCLILPLPWVIAPLCGWNTYALEGLGFSSSVKWAVTQTADVAYIWLLLLLCFFIPLLLISFSYGAILHKIHSVGKNATWGPGHYMTRKNLKIEIKLVKTTLAIIASFLLAWLPYAIVSITTTIRGSEAVSPMMATLPAVYAKCCCVINPLVYVATNSQFRREFWRLVHNRVATSTSSSTDDVCIHSDAKQNSSQIPSDRKGNKTYLILASMEEHHNQADVECPSKDLARCEDSHENGLNVCLLEEEKEEEMGNGNSGDFV